MLSTNISRNLTQETIKSFAKIRYSKVADLSAVPRQERWGPSGKSTGVFGRTWFMLPKGQALFKVFFTEEEDFVYKSESARPQNLLMINEILCSHLAAQIGLPCAQYDLAYFNGYDGVVSYSLLKKGEVVEDYMRGTFQRFYSAMDVEKEYDPTITFDPKMKEDVFKAIIFQILTLQTDGKTDGYVFAWEEKTKNLRFAGLCDNEYAFNVSAFQRHDPHVGDVYGLFGDGFQPLDVIEALNNRISMRYIKLTDSDMANYGYFSRIQEACKFVKDHPEYEGALREILTNLNPEKAFDEIEKTQGIQVDPSYKTYTSKLLQFGLSEFEKELGQEQD